MRTIGEIYDIIDRIAPFEGQLSFDNSGLLIGSREDKISGVLVCLDVTSEAIEMAKAEGCELIVTHHPLIFSPIRSIDSRSLVYKMIANGIGLISAHTSLDAADGGVNDCLAEAIGLVSCERTPNAEIGTTGYLAQPMSAQQLAKLVDERLSAGGKLTTYTDGGKEISKVAVIGGAGGEEAERLMESDCDAIVTGEVKHHQFLMAQEYGKTIIAAGHSSTEKVVLPRLVDCITGSCPELTVVWLSDYPVSGV